MSLEHLDSNDSMASKKNPNENNLDDSSLNDKVFSLEKQNQELLVENEKLKAELFDVKDRMLKSIAETENTRKRLEKERGDLIKYANEKIFKELINVIDGFDKALSTQAPTQENGHAFEEGMKLVHKNLMSTLEKHGLKAIEAKGASFDPNFHQAIQQVEDETIEGETVKEEFAKGYMFFERLLRPSIVVVSVPKGK